MQKLNNWKKWFQAMGLKKALSLKILVYFSRCDTVKCVDFDLVKI